MIQIATDQKMLTVEEIISSDDITFLEKEEALSQLAAYINQLILANFEHLIQLLYRMDVSEMKIKKLLKDNPTMDAGKTIAVLIIERQIQKIKFKQEQSKKEEGTEADGEERW